MAEQLIYLEADDSIAEAVARLQRAKSNDIVLVVPQRALLFQSPINLKILKRQTELLGKTISLVSRDEVGRNFANQAGFKVLEKLGEEVSESPGEIVEQAPPEEMPLRASSKHPTIKYKKYEPRPQDLKTAARITPTESDALSPSPAIRPPKTTRQRIKLERHHQVFIGFVVIGLIVLGSVGFFILPKAHASIEVQSEPFSKQFTLLLADEQDLQAAGPNVLTGRFIEVTREKDSSFDATGEENKGEKATGKVTVVNYTGSIQGLVANTRFRSPNGLIFRLQSEVLVPPARSGNPGKASVAAVADEGGTKYNVSSPMKLTIPGLGSAGIDLVYGEVEGAFAGGTDDITKVVSEEDINKAKEEASKNISVAAEAELSDLLKRGEKVTPEFIQNDVIDVMPSVSAGAKKDQFDVRVQSRSWTILVSQNDLSDAIANAAAFEVPEGKQVTENTVKNAKIEVAESNFLSHRITLVVTLDGRIGPKLDQKEIVASLANKSIPEGEASLRDLPEVTSATIEIWPTFITRIPLLVSNIQLHIIYIGE